MNTFYLYVLGGTLSYIFAVTILALINPFKTFIRSNYKWFLLVLIFLIFQVLLFYKTRDQYLVLLSIFQFFIILIAFSVLFKNKLQKYPFALLQGCWINNYSNRNNSGSESVIINNKGHYYRNGVLKYRLLKFKYNYETNEISFIKKEFNGSLHGREILKVIDFNTLSGHSFKDTNHTIEYKRQ